MTDIRMIALDLDGTTLTRGCITSRTRRALEAAIEQGVSVVIATGRVYGALPKDVFRIRGLQYILTSNGAVITDLSQKTVIYENCISRDAVMQILSLLYQNPHVRVVALTDGQAYVDADVFEELKNHGPAASCMSRSYIMRTTTAIDGILEFMGKRVHRLENISLHFTDDGEKERIRQELKKIDGITLTSSMAHNLEIGGANTSKASGLLALSQLTGIGLDEIMACGDSPNDMAMLSESGFSVVMSNGAPEVLELADFVAPSNEEEGVAYVVERFVLGMERPAWQLTLLTGKNRILNQCRRAARKLLHWKGRR